MAYLTKVGNKSVRLIYLVQIFYPICLYFGIGANNNYYIFYDIFLVIFIEYTDSGHSP